MPQKSAAALRASSPYNAAFTREQFLFYEMRITARLLHNGLSEADAINRIVAENMFQYPTEKSVRRMTLACIRRLKSMNDKALVNALATQSSDVARQICLYAMMKQYRLIWEFMITVIGKKYQSQDTSLTKMDVNGYFMRLQEQDDWVAMWSVSTISKLKQVLLRILVENEYLDNTKADKLNPVLLSPVLNNAIRSNNDDAALIAFNCFV